MKILGIDPGLRTTGFGLIHKQGILHYHAPPKYYFYVRLLLSYLQKE